MNRCVCRITTRSRTPILSKLLPWLSIRLTRQNAAWVGNVPKFKRPLGRINTIRCTPSVNNRCTSLSTATSIDELDDPGGLGQLVNRHLRCLTSYIASQMPSDGVKLMQTLDDKQSVQCNNTFVHTPCANKELTWVQQVTTCAFDTRVVLNERLRASRDVSLLCRLAGKRVSLSKESLSRCTSPTNCGDQSNARVN